ncbi:MAG: hypothetical protein ABI400_04965 [Lacisediminihabitans sp.]
MSDLNAFESFMQDRLTNADDMMTEVGRIGPVIIRDIVEYSPITIEWPQWIKDKVIAEILSQLARAIAQYHKAVAFMRLGIKGMGDPDKLRAAGSTIHDKIYAASDSLAAGVRVGSLKAMDSDDWVGGSSRDYFNSFDGLRDEVRSVTRYSTILETALGDMAKAINDLFITWRNAAIELGIAVAGLIVAIVGSPLVAPLVAGIVAFVGALIAMVVDLWTGIDSYNQSVSDVEGALQPPMGKWPRSTFSATGA